MSRRPRLDETPNGWIRHDERRAPEGWCTEDFDRVSFARRVLDVLRPANVRVLIRDGSREFVVEEGRLWGTAASRWAIVAIPRQASREDIVWTLVELVGYTPGPYRFDVARMIGQALAGDEPT